MDYKKILLIIIGLYSLYTLHFALFAFFGISPFSPTSDLFTTLIFTYVISSVILLVWVIKSLFLTHQAR